MKLDRRALLAGALALGACRPREESGGGVFAAGQPAAILLLALAPDRLLGWPRRPSATALALLPGADSPETGALAGGGAPAQLEAVASLRPTLVIDYGDLNPRFREIAARVERRLGAPYHLIDGALGRTPEALLEAGRLVERERRASELADAARAVLERWRGAGGPSFYYARGGQGLETGFAGSLATEVLEGAGWRNVATGGRGIGRVNREQVAVWDPEVVVTLDGGLARAAARDSFWSTRRSGARRRLLLLPDLPFGWIDRPPSINRLLGCAWLAGGAAEATSLAGLLWRSPAAGMAALAPRWLA